MLKIGQLNQLKVLRDVSPGLILDGGNDGGTQVDILLPGRYIPEGTLEGDLLDVFVYYDSEDRIVATTETPFAMVGEFAYLKVISVNPKVGAFLDWGLSKDLLLPYREQENPVRRGQSVIAGVVLDPTSNRIIATTKLTRHLNLQPATYTEGQPVSLLITSETPLGFNAIVENAHRGLIYRTDLGGSVLTVGQELKGYVRHIRPDGKIDLSLDAAGYKRVAPLTDQILAALKASGGKLAFDDDSSPQAIRDKFSASKKAFKQALGALYKKRQIEFTTPGIKLVK